MTLPHPPIGASVTSSKQSIRYPRKPLILKENVPLCRSFGPSSSRAGRIVEAGASLFISNAESDSIMRPGATSLNSNMIRDGHSACRLKPASPAVPAASAEEDNKNNNDEKCLGIHNVQPF